MNCLDSSFIVDFLDPKQEFHEAATAWMAAHHEEALGTAPICAFEVLRGASRTGDAEFDRTKGFLRTLDVESFGLPEAVIAGDFDGELHVNGSPLSARDTLIAAHARERNDALVTRDRDFAGVPDLDVTFYEHTGE